MSEFAKFVPEKSKDVQSFNYKLYASSIKASMPTNEQLERISGHSSKAVGSYAPAPSSLKKVHM